MKIGPAQVVPVLVLGSTLVTPAAIRQETKVGAPAGQPRRLDDWGALRAWAGGRAGRSTTWKRTRPWTRSK